VRHAQRQREPGIPPLSEDAAARIEAEWRGEVVVKKSQRRTA
jgi:hypothetical protein